MEEAKEREREGGERACVAPLVARAHVSRAIGVEKGWLSDKEQPLFLSPPTATRAGGDFKAR